MNSLPALNAYWKPAMLIPPNKLTTAELNYAAEIPKGWAKEPYRLYALKRLEIIGAMPAQDNVVSDEMLLQLLLEEEGARLFYESGFKQKNNAWGLTTFAPGYPVVVLDGILEAPRDHVIRILRRTTLAHELGHVILHKKDLTNYSQLRNAAQTPSSSMMDIVVPTGDQRAKEYLSKDLISFMHPLPERQGHIWSLEEIMEFQANQIMVGLMLPCINLRICVANFLRMTYAALRERYGWTPCQSLRYNLRQILEDCTKNVARAFAVSKQMAAIEVGRLAYSSNDQPLFLGRMVYPA